MAYFTKNLGTRDRIFRFIGALVFLGLAYWLSSWLLLAAGLFTLFEALFSWCILYQILGKSSCPLNRKK